MTSDLNQLIILVNKCMDLVRGLKSHLKSNAKSSATCIDYLRIAQKLIDTSSSSHVPIRDIVQRTARPPTFYKRIAALRYYLFEEMSSLSSELPSATDELVCKELVSRFLNLSNELEELVALRQIGMVGPRSIRRSKRLALSGLPNNWRTLICERGGNGKYSLPLIICALTGARPQELVHGVEIKTDFCYELGKNQIQFYLRGAKVREKQGQPVRVISYAINDENPLVQLMLKKLSKDTDSEITHAIQIESAVNFTTELRRLAKDLWPKHKHAVTPYCFRHQWASDIKALGDGDAVSLGLGHITTKTRRHYGTSRQSSTGEQLKPVKIEATRPLKHFEKRFGQHFQNLNNAPDCSK